MKTLEGCGIFQPKHQEKTCGRVEVHDYFTPKQQNLDGFWSHCCCFLYQKQPRAQYKHIILSETETKDENFNSYEVKGMGFRGSYEG